MIDEDVLERLLRDEAQTYDPPADGPARIERLAAESAEGRGSRRVTWLAATAAAAAAVVGLLAWGPSSSTWDGGGGGTTSGALKPARDDLLLEDRDGTGGAAAPGAGQPSPAPGAGAAHVVRTGEVTVEVADGRVATALRDATRIATRLGGYVSESQGETASDEPSGFVTMRVPVASFDQAVEEAGRLGEIRRSTTRGQDVSDQVTDTAARLRSLRAARGQLQTLLSRATTVGEVLAVQDKLNDVQTQIEQLQARQASLTDRTTFGTVKVEVVTEGTEAPEPKNGFARAWDDAVDAFVGGFQGLVRASGTLAFVLVVGGVLFLLARHLYRAWMRTVV